MPVGAGAIPTWTFVHDLELLQFTLVFDMVAWFVLHYFQAGAVSGSLH